MCGSTRREGEAREEIVDEGSEWRLSGVPEWTFPGFLDGGWTGVPAQIF